MSLITKKQTGENRNWCAPYGNALSLLYTFTTDASGIFIQSDTPTAPQIGDVIILGRLEAGLLIFDAQVIVSDAFTELTTANIGFQYCDGIDDANAPQDNAYFASALATSATGVSRKTGVKAPIRLKKDAYLILTNAGAAHAAAGQIDVVVNGIWEGFPNL